MATKSNNNKKDKLDHIQVKDNGIKLSQKLGDELSDLTSNLTNIIIRKLLNKANDNDLRRWQIEQNNQLRAFKFESRDLVKATSKNVKSSLINDTSVNLTNKQAKTISSDINKGLLNLQDDAFKQYQMTVQKTVATMHSIKAMKLSDALTKHINTSLDLGVVYKDGKTFKFDTYWEMKARTDIQTEIKDNMISTGHDNGVIFYITSYYGDCAKDHADYQGKIYYDKNWKSNAPKDRIDEIQNYIDSNKLMSVQEVTGAPIYLTSRPNCRHYFQFIDIDSVLGAKTEKEVNQLRNENNLNFNGKYKPEKYKALQQQRLNERRIRAIKAEITKNEELLALNPGDKVYQQRIKNGEARVRHIQANQRELINQYDNLQRRYDREKNNIRVDLGASKELTDGIIDDTIIQNEDVNIMSKFKATDPKLIEEMDKDLLKVYKLEDETPEREEAYLNVLKKYQDGTADKDTFFFDTYAKFERAEKPDREPDHVSKDHEGHISSQYWYTKEGVYRRSNHWGRGVASCDWYLGKQITGERLKVNQSKSVGFVKWEDIYKKPIDIWLLNEDGKVVKAVATFKNMPKKDVFKMDGVEYIYNYKGKDDVRFTSEKIIKRETKLKEQALNAAKSATEIARQEVHQIRDEFLSNPESFCEEHGIQYREFVSKKSGMDMIELNGNVYKKAEVFGLSVKDSSTGVTTADRMIIKMLGLKNPF